MPFTIGTHTVKALVDTGSPITLMEKLAFTHLCRCGTITNEAVERYPEATAVNSTTLKTEGAARLEITIGNKTELITVVLVYNPFCQVLFGLDILKSFKIGLNIERKIATMDGVEDLS